MLQTVAGVDRQGNARGAGGSDARLEPGPELVESGVGGRHVQGEFGDVGESRCVEEFGDLAFASEAKRTGTGSAAHIERDPARLNADGVQEGRGQRARVAAHERIIGAALDLERAGAFDVLHTANLLGSHR